MSSFSRSLAALCLIAATAVATPSFAIQDLERRSVSAASIDPAGWGAIMVDAEGHLAWRDSGERLILVEANSNENRLRYWAQDPGAEYERLKAMRSWGVNTVWVIIWGTDDPNVRLTPETLPDYRAFVETWTAMGGITHIVLGEQENHHLLSDAERRQLCDLALEMGRGCPVIYCIGEEITQRVGVSYVKKWSAYLRQKAAGPILISVHNELNWRPWSSLVGQGVVDLLAFQGSASQAKSELESWYQRGLATAHPWAVYESEVTPANQGIKAGDVAKALDWFWACPNTSGVGVYGGSDNDGCSDLDCSNPWAYQSVFEALGLSAWSLGQGFGRDGAVVLGVPAKENEPYVHDASELILSLHGQGR